MTTEIPSEIEKLRQRAEKAESERDSLLKNDLVGLKLELLNITDQHNELIATLDTVFETSKVNGMSHVEALMALIARDSQHAAEVAKLSAELVSYRQAEEQGSKTYTELHSENAALRAKVAVMEEPK